MSIAKTKRHAKRQMGQFLTPRPLAYNLVNKIKLRREDKILEPSMGDGSFILPLIERFMKFYRGSVTEKLTKVLQNNIYGAELDKSLYAECLRNIKNEWGVLPPAHNFVCGDFLLTDFCDNGGQTIVFDYVVGNPPFGGTINPAYQDILDKQFGVRGGLKIKKETYSFFIVKSMDMLRYGGRLMFICSDTFLTINTMKGLRNFLFYSGKTEVDGISFFSDEVSQKTVLLKCVKGESACGVAVDKKLILEDDIKETPNYSWQIVDDMIKYFRGPKIGNFMTASSGMTVGKNEYFVRDIVDGAVTEPYCFSFYQKPVTVADAVARARLSRLSASRRLMIQRQQDSGATVRDVRIQKRTDPVRIKLPHPDYCYYNKARKGIVYAPPAHAVFWRDNGDAVYTYKQNGNWYLNGIGGKQYFLREGITWNLIASRLHLRYLPAGYVLDSGAPCAFLNTDTHKNEMFFILAWGLTDLCRDILKKVINHTKNIQGKDFERLPYPFWVNGTQKSAAVRIIKSMIRCAQAGNLVDFTDARMREINAIFADEEYFNQTEKYAPATKSGEQISLIAQMGG